MQYFGKRIAKGFLAKKTRFLYGFGGLRQSSQRDGSDKGVVFCGTGNPRKRAVQAFGGGGAIPGCGFVASCRQIRIDALGMANLIKFSEADAKSREVQ